jgi:hypothetical protein
MTYITSTQTPESLLMRRATGMDTARIRLLARLDDRRMPVGPFIVAEVGGEIVAARSLTTGDVVADPFRLTADAVAMLSLRAAQVGAPSAQLHRIGRRQSEQRFAVAA